MNAKKWINTNDLHLNLKRLTPAKHEDFENVVCIWIQEKSFKIATIMRDTTRKQAKSLWLENEHHRF